MSAFIKLVVEFDHRHTLDAVVQVAQVAQDRKATIRCDPGGMGKVVLRELSNVHNIRVLPMELVDERPSASNKERLEFMLNSSLERAERECVAYSGTTDKAEGHLRVAAVVVLLLDAVAEKWHMP